MAWDHSFRQTRPRAFDGNARKRAHPDLNQGPADLQSAALTTELCTHMLASCQRGSKCETSWQEAAKATQYGCDRAVNIFNQRSGAVVSVLGS